MTSKTGSWKDKVDPAMISHIKNFLRVVETIDTMAVRERSQEVARCLTKNGIISFKQFYEHRNDEKFVLKLIDTEGEFFSMEGCSELLVNIEKQKLLRNKIPPEISLWLSFKFLNFVCLMVDKKSLYELYEEAKNGNQKSLLTLLRYDKTLFDHEWFRKQIFEEMVLANDIFFDRLGEAIKSEPTIAKHGRSRLKYVVIAFWKSIFSKLTYNEQIDLLEELGFELKADPGTYKKFVLREIKPLFKK